MQRLMAAGAGQWEPVYYARACILVPVVCVNRVRGHAPPIDLRPLVDMGANLKFGSILWYRNCKARQRSKKCRWSEIEV